MLVNLQNILKEAEEGGTQFPASMFPTLRWRERLWMLPVNFLCR